MEDEGPVDPFLIRPRDRPRRRRLFEVLSELSMDEVEPGGLAAPSVTGYLAGAAVAVVAGHTAR